MVTVIGAVAALGDAEIQADAGTALAVAAGA
jgi:hypothetical protein